MKPLVIFGTGAFARVAYVYFANDSLYNIVGFTVDRPYMNGENLMGLPIVPSDRLLEMFPNDEVGLFIAIGFSRLNKARAEVFQRMKKLGYTLATYVSSKAVHWGDLTCGENCFILENSVIQPFARIGNDVVIWSGSHIGHDVVIGDHCFISSQVVLSGHVRVGDYCFLGVNACAKHGIEIAPECLIGSGAVLLKNTEPHTAYLVKSTPGITVPAAELENLI